MNDLLSVYKTHLKMMLSIEEQIIGALPNMIAEATSDMLKSGLSMHLEETKVQRDRLVTILTAHGESGSEEDVAFKTLLAESDKKMAMITDPHVKDAVIIASAQVVEHIEMAKYGTLISWAKTLKDDENLPHLKDTLAEEGSSDKKLSGVAVGGIFTTGVNEKAA